MRVLVDTNVLLDYLLNREPFSEHARKIILSCKEKKIQGCIAAHSISNMFFILRKEFSVEERKAILTDLCLLFTVEGIDRFKLLSALKNEDFKDFEDCLQMECAKSFQADYIITRNIDDFKNCQIACMTPEKFCILLEIQK